MISVEAPGMRKKEQPGRAAAYLLYGKDYDQANEKNRVLFKGILNAESEEFAEAAAEMTSLCDLGRKGGRHTVHYIISLRPGEHLTRQQWTDVLRIHLKQIGAEKLMTLWTVHKDTDNEHLHILLCTLDPQTRKTNSLSFSHRGLQEADAACEQRYRLQEDSHPLCKGEPTRTRPETQAADYEAKTGRQSLLAYVQELIPEIRKVAGWQELHTLLNRHGLTLAKTGRGLAVTTPSPDDPAKTIAVKGSAISRNKEESLALQALEERLGPWEEAFVPLPPQEQRYEGRPVGFDAARLQPETHEDLQSEFEKFRKDAQAARPARDDLRREFSQNKAQRRKEIRDAKNRARRDLENLDAERMSSAEHRQTSEAIREKLAQDLLKADRDYEKRAKKLKSRWKKIRSAGSFMEYLKGGFSDPLSRPLLFTRKGSLSQKEINRLVIRGATKAVTGFRMTLTHTPFLKRTRKGQDIYRNPMSGDLIRDDGRSFLINSQPMITTVADLLLLASDRASGRTLIIRGRADFQLMAVREAIRRQIKVQSDQIWIQSYYLRNINERGRNLGGGLRSYGAAALRRAYRRGELGGGIRSVGGIRRVGDIRSAGGIRGAGGIPGFGHGGGRSAFEPDAAPAGTAPRSANPAAGSDLPPLSGSPVDGKKETGPVLLRPDEQLHLGEHLGDGLLRRVRREVQDPAGNGGKITVPAAVTEYLKERNAKYEAGVPGVLPHRLWSGEHGTVIFRGLRNTGSVKIALFESNQQITVKICSDAAIKRLKNVKIGQNVEIKPDGMISVPHEAARRHR